MYQKRGLIYSLLDKNGEKIGVPIKSSALYSRPTLTWLEQQFESHLLKRSPLKADLKETIDKVLIFGAIHSAEDFKKGLKSQGINVLFRKSATGQTYGITFIDNNRKIVFNGSDLGKNYSAKAILNQISSSDALQKTSLLTLPIHQKGMSTKHFLEEKAEHFHKPETSGSNLLDRLLVPAQDHSDTMSKKKKKKKRNLTI